MCYYYYYYYYYYYDDDDDERATKTRSCVETFSCKTSWKIKWRCFSPMFKHVFQKVSCVNTKF